MNTNIYSFNGDLLFTGSMEDAEAFTKGMSYICEDETGFFIVYASGFSSIMTWRTLDKVLSTLPGEPRRRQATSKEVSELINLAVKDL